MRNKGAGQQQGIDMTTQEREIDLLSDEINRLSIAELDAVSGGRIRWIDIHMPYNDFIKWPGANLRRPVTLESAAVSPRAGSDRRPARGLGAEFA